MNKFFIIFDSTQNIENLFSVTDNLQPRQNPILSSDSKEELESICVRFNDVLRSQMKIMLEDENFFLK
jgi:hypothetical protein